MRSGARKANNRCQAEDCEKRMNYDESKRQWTRVAEVGLAQEAPRLCQSHMTVWLGENAHRAKPRRKQS